MARKTSSPKHPSKANLKAEARQEIQDSLSPILAENPMKRQIKVKSFPWTENQKRFFRVALHPDTKIMFVNGPAGTSKTLLAVYCGLQLLNMKTISDIMYLRSAVESSEAKLGFLPGTAEDKLRFYNLPFLDKLDELLATTRAEKLEAEGRISMFPVNFARGLHWDAKCIILDEAQNSTAKEITTVLTRMGKYSKCFVLADPMQTDLRHQDQRGAFESMVKTFSDQESQEMGIHVFTFDEDDIMRSELVKYLAKKLRNQNGK
jgi:phosphate starvation-inducible PhoH-like protein